jgi:L-lactate dehydrogenase
VRSPDTTGGTGTLCRSRHSRGENRALTVSRVQDGALGVKDLALSLPAIVGARGTAHVVAPELSRTEREQFEHSAAVLRQAMASLA